MTPIQIACDISKHGKWKTPLKLEKDLSLKDIKKMHIILTGNYPDIALAYLERCGVLDKILPEFDKVVLMKGKAFKAVWPHTLTVVKQSKNDLIIRWAALFHDFGKPLTFKYENKKVSFTNHEFVSARLFRKFANDYKIFNTLEYNSIKFIIKNLGYVESYNSNWTESAVRRFAKENNEHVGSLLTLSRADITTSKEWKRANILKKIDELELRIEEVKKKDSIRPLLPTGIGCNIISIFKLEPGIEVKIIKDKLIKEIENGNLKAYQDKEYYSKWMEGNRLTLI